MIDLFHHFVIQIDFSRILINQKFKNRKFESSNFNIEIQELYDEPADVLCTEFYEEHYGLMLSKPQAVYIAHGGQSAVYRCYSEVRDREIFMYEWNPLMNYPPKQSYFDNILPFRNLAISKRYKRSRNRVKYPK